MTGWVFHWKLGAFKTTIPVVQAGFLVMYLAALIKKEKRERRKKKEKREKEEREKRKRKRREEGRGELPPSTCV